MPLLVLITGKAEAAKLSKNTSKAVMVLTIVERYTAKTAYLSGKINTIQLPDVSCKSCAPYHSGADCEEIWLHVYKAHK